MQSLNALRNKMATKMIEHTNGFFEFKVLNQGQPTKFKMELDYEKCNWWLKEVMEDGLDSNSLLEFYSSGLEEQVRNEDFVFLWEVLVKMMIDTMSGSLQDKLDKGLISPNDSKLFTRCQ